MGIEDSSCHEEEVEHNDSITIFWKNNRPIGTCFAGQESNWLKLQKGNEQPDYQTSSTNDRWHAYMRHRVKQIYTSKEDVEQNEKEALKFL